MAIPSLKGKIALVTGASRGIGKGIALSLGEAGATVYITGRTTHQNPATVPLSGTVEETAAAVTQSGGQGIAVQCDHRDDAQVEAVFQRIENDYGHLDILVNVAWAGYEGLHDGSDFPLDQKFWQRRLSYWDDNLSGLRAAYIASALAARLMTPRKSGLIVNISNAITGYGNPAYNLAKIGTDRLTADTASDLSTDAVTVVGLYPGLVRTEGIMQYEQYMDLSNSESPQFTGRAIVALAADAHVQQKTGRCLWVSDLAAEYQFTDTDGTRPIPTWKPA